MRIDIVTVLPELLQSPFDASIVKRAIDKGLVNIVLHNLRDYASNAYRQVDDYPFGGGAGLVLMAEPIDKCLSELTAARSYDEIIYLTPDGETLKQGLVNQLSLKENVLILCGHYKGVDQRIRDLWITREISIGDYVLSGGELGAAILADAIVRLSALTDTFQDNLLAPPVYTRPREFKGLKVPEVLLEGNTAKIDTWREDQAYKRTSDRRPDLLDLP